VFADLLAEHSKQIGLAVLAGTYANGQPEGVFTSTATNSVTYTATTATAAGVYTAVAKAAERVASQRFDAPTAIVMAPRRWLWLAQSTDTTGRPLVVPTGDSNQSVNSMAPAGDLNFGSAVGTMLGLPVYLDANVSTTYATNQDRIIVARFSDAHIYETGPKCEVFREPLSGSLGLRFRCYSYMATTGVRRFPASFSVVSGTGLADPPW
jgi:HK97 family phage major capsid protein